MELQNQALEHLLRKTYHHGISYAQYRELTNDLISQGKTTGPIQTPDYIHYTELNKVRMDRLDKTTILLQEVASTLLEIKRKIDLIIITEAWCGDAAQVLPVIQKMTDYSDLLSSRYILRDEHPEVMDHFLTEGGRSIPVVIGICQATGELLGKWGPRPMAIQAMVMERKQSAEPIPYEEFSVMVQKWYAKDKTASIQGEFSHALFSWADVCLNQK